MARAFLPSASLGRPPRIPQMRFRWRGARVGADELAEFAALTGLRTDPLPVLFPHVFGFRLVMALLTDPRYPLPIWNALQIRNSLRQHERFTAADTFDIETSVAEWRVLAKGLEVDLRTTFSTRGKAVWESIVTFYYRGIFGEPMPPHPEATPPPVRGREIARWQAAIGQGRRFGRLTGDYNGIHWSNGYARYFGFRGAFHHPQRAVGESLAHLSIDTSLPCQRLDVWVRGQVYEGAGVSLQAEGDNPATLALVPQDDPRPAIVARWSGERS